MEKHFLDLPPEVREHILGFCKAGDIVNLACCNSDYRNAVSYHLFSCLRIYWDTLKAPSNEPFIERKLPYLKFAKLIRFGGIEKKTPRWPLISKNCIHILNSCHNLHTLHISHTNGTCVKRILRTLKNIKDLTLCFSIDLHILCWKELTNMISLVRLSLWFCKASDDAIKIISKHTQIEDLKLVFCSGLSEDIYVCISEMKQLKRFTLASSDTDKNELFWLNKLNKLNHLTLILCQGQESSLDNVIMKICSSSIRLKTLGIPLCEVGDSALSAIKLQKSLTCIDLSHNEISDIPLRSISTLNLLTELDLSHCCKISNDGITELNSLKLLKILKLNHCCYLTDMCLKHLSIPTLKVLSLNGCTKVTDEGMSYLKSLILLEKLEVQNLALSDAGLMYIAVLRLKLLKISTNLLSKRKINQFNKKSNMKITLKDGTDWTFMNVF